LLKNIRVASKRCNYQSDTSYTTGSYIISVLIVNTTFLHLRSGECKMGENSRFDKAIKILNSKRRNKFLALGQN